MFRLSTATYFAVLALLAPPAYAATVPRAGCAMDGQTGPVAAPANGTMQTNLSAEIASHLAYFYAGDPQRTGVLAPKDWHCFGTQGSGGFNLFVTPTQLSSEQFFGKYPFKGIGGPAIQYSIIFGGTSGRFPAAQIIAQVFPQEQKFAQDVAAERLAPASDFHFGAYPEDHLTRRDASVVEYETPAGSKGLGLVSLLLPDETPITGTVILLDRDRDILHLAIRLPPSMRNLSDVIIRRAEADNPERP